MLEQSKREGLTRDVRIEVVNKIDSPNGANIWLARIELIDMSQKISDSFSTKWLVTIRVAFQPQRKGIEWSQRLRNPLGFTVTNFGIKSI